MTDLDREIIALVRRIRRLAQAQLATALLALVALLAGGVSIELAAATAKTNRREAAQDSCRLLVGLVNAATPPSKQADAQAYINKTPLHDCHLYARRLFK